MIFIIRLKTSGVLVVPVVRGSKAGVLVGATGVGDGVGWLAVKSVRAWRGCGWVKIQTNNASWPTTSAAMMPAPRNCHGSKVRRSGGG